MSNITKVEFMGIPLVESKAPVYKTEVLGVPVWILGAVIVGYNLQKQGKLI